MQHRGKYASFCDVTLNDNRIIQIENATILSKNININLEKF